MFPIFINLVIYETKRFWRYSDNAPFLENGLVEMTTTKQPIVYFRGTPHFLYFLKTVISDFGGLLVRNGANAVKFRVYVPSEDVLVKFEKLFSQLSVLPFFYLTTVSFFNWRWRYSIFGDFLKINGELLGPQNKQLLANKIVNVAVTWSFRLFSVFTPVLVHQLFIICFLRRV